MSDNFLRVKRDILKDMKDISYHTQESWAEIMLKHSQFLTTVEDQQSFWNFILNPSDERDYVSPNFYTYDPNDVAIKEFQKLTVVCGVFAVERVHPAVDRPGKRICI